MVDQHRKTWWVATHVKDHKGSERLCNDRTCCGDSNMKLTVSPLSSAFIVMMSSLPAHCANYWVSISACIVFAEMSGYTVQEEGALCLLW